MKLLSCIILLSPLSVLAAPQAPQQLTSNGFGNASPDEIAQIRAGTFGDMFDDNPQYNYNYKVADSIGQNYIAMNENRDGQQVTGSYQYIDPTGALIIVNYTAGPMGYSETREVKKGVIEVTPRPVTAQSGGTSFAGSSGSNFGSSGIGSSFGSSSGNFGSSGSSLGSSGSSFGSSTGFSSGSNSASSLGSFTGGSSGSFTGSSFGSGSSSTLGSSQSSTSTSSLNSGSSSSGFSVQSTAEQLGLSNTDDLVSSIASQLQPLIPGVVSGALATKPERPITQVVIPNGLQPILTPPPRRTFDSSNIASQVLAQISPLVSSSVSSAFANNAAASASSTNRQSSRAQNNRFANNSGFRSNASSNLVAVPAVPQAASRGRSSAADLIAEGSVNGAAGPRRSLEELFGKPDQANVRVNTPFFKIQY